MEYLQLLKTIDNTLVVASQPLNDCQFTSYLLASLGSEYDPFVTFVTNRVEPLTIDNL